MNKFMVCTVRYYPYPACRTSITGTVQHGRSSHYLFAFKNIYIVTLKTSLKVIPVEDVQHIRNTCITYDDHWKEKSISNDWWNFISK
jgi:hypothetical protein